MKTLPKTSMHLNVCGSNFFKLRKLLQDFKGPGKSFEKSVSQNEIVLIKFNLLSKTKHTLTYEVKHIHPEDSLNNFIIRFCVFIDAKMVEVISFQGEKPFPFYIKNKSALQSYDEKHQQNTFFFDLLENLLTFAEEIIE
jgi:uncharacterized protein YqiB (DUF1249 family)